MISHAKHRTKPATSDPSRQSPLNHAGNPGEYYKTTVPDTLDLAERARLGLSHCTSIISPEDGYTMYAGGGFGPDLMHLDDPELGHLGCQAQCCEPKYMEAMAMLRVASGSRRDLELENKWLEAMVSCLGEEGLYWVMPSGGRRPWNGPEEMRPYAHVHGQSDFMLGMIAWHQYTGDPRWATLIDRMIEGVDRVMVVHKDDYAYFPTLGWMPEEYFRSCFVKGRGWKSTAEPENEKAGEEGSLFNHQGRMVEALSNWHMLTGNAHALELAGELARFLMKPRFWADHPQGDYPSVVGSDHAHWTGHFHGTINILQGILQYGVATNDPRLKQFARDGYEWARQGWYARVGIMGDGQSCGTARLIRFAISLTDAGVDDYWEDVDLYIRNHGTEAQFTPEHIPHLKTFMKPPSDALAKQRQDRALNAMMGSFHLILPMNRWFCCCAPWGNMGLYFAWEGTLRHADRTARVNLLLNRASPWMDVESHLPYEGKVILRNKTAREASVRIPLWVDKATVTCRVNRKTATPAWFGQYLRFEKLRPDDVVAIELTMRERSEKWKATEPIYARYGAWPGHPPGTEMVFTFRGNTLTDISPWPILRLGSADGTKWPCYSRRAKQFSAPKAPAVKVERFVTPGLISYTGRRPPGHR